MIDTDAAFHAWGRAYRDTTDPLGYPSRNAMDGNLALREVRRYRNRGGTPADGKETIIRRSREPHIDEVAQSVERFMGQLRPRSSAMHGVLVAYYLHRMTLQRIAHQSKLTIYEVRTLRDTGLARYEGWIM